MNTRQVSGAVKSFRKATKALKFMRVIGVGMEIIGLGMAIYDLVASEVCYSSHVWHWVTRVTFAEQESPNAFEFCSL